MSRARALLAVVAIFAVGVLVGVAGTHAFYLRELRQPGGMARLGMRIMAADLDRRLDLDDAQQAEVDRILAETQGEALAIRRHTITEVMAMLQRTQQRIDVVLTPAQRETYRLMRERNRERAARFFSM